MKRITALFIVGMLTVVMVACGTTDKEEEGSDTGSEEDTKVTITHELDETTVEKNPKTVIVFDFGTLDTLDKLGIEVAGVAKGNIPSYLEEYENDNYENIGSLKEPDFEKIAEIDPDLILISGRQSPMYDELTKLAPTVFLGVDTERYMDSFEENLEVIGEIFGKESEIEEELANIEDSISTLHEKATTADKNALIILANDDKIAAYGPNSRFGMIHDVFGIPAVDENIETATHGMNVSFEYVKEKDPDMLYVVDRGAAIGEDSSAKKMVENKLIKPTKAYQNDNIVYLDPDFWYLSGGGLVSVAEMVDEIVASLE